MPLSFLLTCLVIVIAPGPGNVYSFSTGLSRGARAGVLAAAACTLGIVPHLVLAVSGLGALVHATPGAFAILRYAGCAYLVWLAWSLWRAPAPAPDGSVAPRGSLGILRDGVTLNLLNPKLTLFFLAFLPPFVTAEAEHPLLTLIALAGVFMAMTLVVFALTAVFAGSLGSRIASRPRVGIWAQRVLALVLLGMAIALAMPTT